jgi:hypothetical protein
LAGFSYRPYLWNNNILLYLIQLEQFRKKKAAKKATAASAEQAKAPAPDVVENPPPIVNAGSLGDGLVSDVDPNQASTSSVPLSVYENGPASASRGAEFLSNGPQQDAVSDGGSKFYGNLSFSDLVNGHHENWRGDGARKKDEHSPDKDVESKSKLSAFGNGSSLNLPSTENMPSWGRNSLSSQVHDTEQSSSYSSSTLFGKSKNAYAQDYSTNSDIFGRLRGKFEALFSCVETRDGNGYKPAGFCYPKPVPVKNIYTH